MVRGTKVPTAWVRWKAKANTLGQMGQAMMETGMSAKTMDMACKDLPMETFTVGSGDWVNFMVTGSTSILTKGSIVVSLQETKNMVTAFMTGVMGVSMWVGGIRGNNMDLALTHWLIKRASTESGTMERM